MKKIMIIGFAAMATAGAAVAQEYQLQFINPDGFNRNDSGKQAIEFLTQSMNFETDMNALQEIKAERQFSTCLLDHMWRDKQEYGLSDQEFTGLIEDVANYYHDYGTPYGFTMSDETTEYVGDLEISCVDFHPNPAGVHMELAEQRVMEECNWEDVSTKEEFDAAANCRKQVTREYYEEEGVKPYWE